MTRTWIAAVLLASVAGVAPAQAEGTDTPAPPPAEAAAEKVRRPGKVPYRVLKLMPAQDQALVLDRSSGEHLLVQLGDDLGEFQVIDLDDEELVLWRDGREIVLPLDTSAPAPAAVLAKRPPQAAPAAVAPAPLDPYAAVPASPPPSPGERGGLAAPMDPYAPSSIPVVSAAAPPATSPPAPAPAAADPAWTDPDAPRVVLAPAGQRASLETAEVLDPYAQPAEPAVVRAPTAAAPVKGVPAPQSDAARAMEIRTSVMPLSRGQLEASLASFDKLAKDHRFELTPRGVKLRDVGPTTYAYALGLRAGDVVTAIDGAPLRGLDDAAAAYVRLSSARELALAIERGGATGTLRFSIQ